MMNHWLHPNCLPLSISPQISLLFLTSHSSSLSYFNTCRKYVSVIYFFWCFLLTSLTAAGSDTQE